uniref:Uncharacterized protein n=1 Tax=Arundo donax TaxID=35708 RepID=A0A0A9HPR6_ARUDO
MFSGFDLYRVDLELLHVCNSECSRAYVRWRRLQCSTTSACDGTYVPVIQALRPPTRTNRRKWRANHKLVLPAKRSVPELRVPKPELSSSMDPGSGNGDTGPKARALVSSNHDKVTGRRSVRPW